MKMRIYHRYLGFFLAGIMAVYALSGFVLIFRDTDTFKKETIIQEQLKPNLTTEMLGKALGIRDLKIEKEEGEVLKFKNGTYNQKTGKAEYSKVELPYLLDQMTHLHKAKSSRPLAFLNMFFGVSLFFFVISSFWMFAPGTSVFKKGMYFALGGLVLALLLIFI